VRRDDKSFRDSFSLSIMRLPPFFAQTDIKWVRSGGTVAPSLLPSFSLAALHLSLLIALRFISTFPLPFLCHVILIAYIHISGSGDILGG